MNNIDSIAMNNEIPEPEVCTKRSRPPALTVKQLLHCRLMKLMQTQGLWNERLAVDIPSSWEKFDNFVVFSNKCFKDADWSKAGPQLWKVVADVFSVENVALKGRIENDSYRSPRMEIVYGNSNLVQFKDNGIRYTWSATSCMFSRGNVTERHRVGRMDCRGEVVVDLFAGIGYFTLPFLVKAHCEHLHACEWNRNAVECLKHNLKLNKVDKKCTIHEGDNRKVCPQNIADRVNLGLIPTSQDSWRTACLALKSQTGGVLHVHENLNTKLTNSLCPCQCPTHVCQAFKCDKCVQLLKLSCIKCVDEFPIDLTFKLTIKHNELFHNQSESGDKSELDQKSNEIVTHHVSRQNSTVELVSMDETLYLTLVKDKLSWKNYEFMIWALHTCHSFTQIFYEIYKQPWSVSVKNIHHVKSYAPHIEHMVLDLDCRPSNEEHSEIRSSKY